MWERIKAFLKRKDVEVSVKRYGIDALGAMAQGLFCSLLIGTILNTLGTQLHIGFLTNKVATVSGVSYTVGGLASAMSGPAMAVAIGYALKCPPLVLFSLITVGFASNALGGAGGPLAVYFVAIIAAEAGKLISKETKIDILVTPLVTIGAGTGVAALIAPALGKAAMKIGEVIMLATNLQPFLMGIAVSVLVGIALTLPISSAAICAAFGLTGLAGGAAVAGCCAQMVGFAVMSFKENRWGGLVSQGIGTSMLQMGNIIKNPRIWIAPIVTSAMVDGMLKEKSFDDIEINIDAELDELMDMTYNKIASNINMGNIQETIVRAALSYSKNAANEAINNYASGIYGDISYRLQPLIKVYGIITSVVFKILMLFIYIILLIVIIVFNPVRVVRYTLPCIFVITGGIYIFIANIIGNRCMAAVSNRYLGRTVFIDTQIAYRVMGVMCILAAASYVITLIYGMVVKNRR